MTGKFRGIRNGNLDFVYGYYFAYRVTGGGELFHHIMDVYGTWQIDHKTLGEFTGQQDNDKTDIYSDDILKSNHSIKIVYFDKGVFGTKDKNHNPVDPHPLFKMNMENWKVIGNIHKNKELLN